MRWDGSGRSGRLAGQRRQRRSPRARSGGQAANRPPGTPCRDTLGARRPHLTRLRVEGGENRRDRPPALSSSKWTAPLEAWTTPGLAAPSCLAESRSAEEGDTCCRLSAVNEAAMSGRVRMAPASARKTAPHSPADGNTMDGALPSTFRLHAAQPCAGARRLVCAQLCRGRDGEGTRGSGARAQPRAPCCCCSGRSPARRATGGALLRSRPCAGAAGGHGKDQV